MKAYISVSFNNRKLIDKEIAAITNTLNAFRITSFVFIDHYRFEPAQEKQMMEKALECIDHCDLLIAETSSKEIGIGIEVGYAKAQGKPVIYLRQQEAEHSTTVSGISDFQVIYLDTTDLRNKLTDIINGMKATMLS